MMQSLDLLACKAGHHDFDDDLRCKVCRLTGPQIHSADLRPRPVLGLGGAVVAMAQPSPYSASLPRVDAVRAADTTLAFGELEAWIDRAPGDRGCWAINRLAGKWRVGLGTGGERFTAGQDAELRGAIRNALMIAKFAGHL